MSVYMYITRGITVQYKMYGIVDRNIWLSPQFRNILIIAIFSENLPTKRKITPIYVSP